MRFTRTSTPPVVGPYAGLLDDFNRANGVVGANWTTDILHETINALSITGNQLYGPNNDNSGWWNVDVFDDNCDVCVDVATWDTSANFRGVILFARMQKPGTVNASGYALAVQPNSNSRTGHYWILRRYDNTVATTLKQIEGPAPGSGDQLWFALRGNTLVGYHRTNGDGHFTPVVTAADNTYRTGGYVGLRTENAADRFDNFSAGTASPIRVRGRSSGEAAALSWVIPKPTADDGTALGAGDVVYVHINTGRGFTVWTPPTGFVKLAEAGDGNNRQEYVFRKVLDGTEGATFTFTADGGSPFGTWNLVVLSGVDLDNPEDVATSANNGGASTATPSTTAQTPTSKIAMLLGFFGCRPGSGGATGTASGLATEVIENRALGASAMPSYVAVKASRNASTSISVTTSISADWAMIQVAVRPTPVRYRKKLGGALSGSSVTVPAGGVPIGDLVLVAASQANGAPTDPRGNTYTQVASIGTTSKVALWLASITTALLEGDVVQIASGDNSIAVYHFTGASALDASGTTVDSFSAKPSVTSGVPAAAQEIAFGIFWSNTSAVTGFVDAGWDLLDFDFAGSGGRTWDAAYRILRAAAAQTYTPDANLSASSTFSGIVATFKTSSGTLYTATITATSSGIATLLKQPGKLLAAGATGAASLVKTPLKTLAAATSGLASLVRFVSKQLAASSASSASVARAPSRTISTSSVAVSQVVKTPSKILATGATGSAIVASLKVKIATLAASVTGSAALSRVVSKLLAVTSVETPSLRRVVSRTLAVGSAASPLVTKSLARTFAIGATGSSTVSKQPVKRLAVSANTSAFVSTLRNLIGYGYALLAGRRNGTAVLSARAYGSARLTAKIL